MDQHGERLPGLGNECRVSGPTSGLGDRRAHSAAPRALSEGLALDAVGVRESRIGGGKSFGACVA